MMKRVTIMAVAAGVWTVAVFWADASVGQVAQTRPAQATSSPSVLLDKGIYAEETTGNLDEAIKVYQQIVADAKANRPVAAQAQYRLAMCYLKKGDKTKAVTELQNLLASYPQEKDTVALAQKELAKLVPADTAPRVTKTTPQTLSNDVDPALDRLSVTFDQKMIDGNWSWVQRYADKYPKMTGKPSFDDSRTVCSVSVKIEPGKVYWIEFNSPPFDSFMSESGKKKAKRHALLFATKDADGKPTPLPDDLVKLAKEINTAAAGRIGHFMLSEPARASAMHALAESARVQATSFTVDLKTGRTEEAYKRTSEDYRKNHKSLDTFAKAADLSNAEVNQVLVADEAACVII